MYTGFAPKYGQPNVSESTLTLFTNGVRLKLQKICEFFVELDHHYTLTGFCLRNFLT